MGITQWVRRDLPVEVVESVASPVSEVGGSPIEAVPDSGEPSMSKVILDVSHSGWDELRQVVSGCAKCELSKTRTRTVFGAGSQQADWLIIGEAPGEQEDRQGEPFVGRAGLLLNNMIKAVGFEREGVYIANVVKCRPPQNRDPHLEEVLACSSYLKRQIALIQPKLVLVVGRVAAQHLLNTSDAVGRMRGKLHRYPGTDTPLIVTYHPAYLLRRPIEKRKSWEDLKFALATYRSLQA
ncbi:unnamed protein product [Cyprideis torosa]|uniref:Type-4 uracil-DNA glycosylase n=1 Tax=Cyprideis torosa TaxID=163714 RepID=A0A7R8ZW72_9CRUS|nr:unnamed protein product [Cyprideis torosa]CAG0908654.1 unnamed protein product [Cyprideis torosa]